MMTHRAVVLPMLILLGCQFIGGIHVLPDQKHQRTDARDSGTAADSGGQQTTGSVSNETNREASDAGRKNEGGSGGGAGAKPSTGTAGNAGGSSERDAGRAVADTDADQVDHGFIVVKTKPEQGDLLDNATTPLVIELSRSLEIGSVTNATFIVHDSLEASNERYKGTISAQGKTITFSPENAWRLARTYDVSLTSDIFSTNREPLKASTLEFRMREGTWTSEHVISESQNLSFSDPAVAVAAYHHAAVAWNDYHMKYPTTGVATRDYSANTWSAVEALGDGLGIHTGIRLRDDGTIITGHQPANPGGLPSMLCYTAQGQIRNVPLPDLRGATIAELTVSALGIQFVLLPLERQSILTVDTECEQDPPREQTSRDILAADASRRISEVHASEALVAWTQADADAGVVTSVWSKERGDFANAKAQLVSSPMLVADSPAVTDRAIVWRQADATAGSADVIWAQTGMHTQAISARADGPARAPLIAVAGVSRAFVVWIQGEPSQARVMGMTLPLGDAGSPWPSPVVLSETFNDDGQVTLNIAFNAYGQGVVVWSQPTGNANADGFSRYDVYAIPINSADGFLSAQRKTISVNHDADSAVSIAIDAYGQAVASWKESKAIWVGRYY